MRGGERFAAPHLVPEKIHTKVFGNHLARFAIATSQINCGIKRSHGAGFVPGREDHLAQIELGRRVFARCFTRRYCGCFRSESAATTASRVRRRIRTRQRPGTRGLPSGRDEVLPGPIASQSERCARHLGLPAGQPSQDQQSVSDGAGKPRPVSSAQ